MYKFLRDTDDEDEKKASYSKPTTKTVAANNQSKSSALDLLSTQLKSVKASMFDFEEDVEEEVDGDDGDEDDDNNNILNFGAKLTEKKTEKFEVPKHEDSSDSSF